MRTERTTATTPLLTASEVMRFMNVTDDNEKSLIAKLTEDATRWVENHIGKTLRPLTYVVWYDYAELAVPYLELPYGPVNTIDEVLAYKTDNTSTEVETYTFTSGDTRLYNIEVPSSLRDYNTLKVTFTTKAPTQIENELTLAIKSLALHWYDNRGEGTIPSIVKPLLLGHRPFLICAIGGQ